MPNRLTSQNFSLTAIIPVLMIFTVGCGGGSADNGEDFDPLPGLQSRPELLDNSNAMELDKVELLSPIGFQPESDSTVAVTNKLLASQKEGNTVGFTVKYSHKDASDDMKTLWMSEVESVTGMYAKFPKFVDDYEKNWLNYAPNAKTSRFTNGKANIWQSRRADEKVVHYRWLVQGVTTKPPVQIDLYYPAGEDAQMKQTAEAIITSMNVKK